MAVYVSYAVEDPHNDCPPPYYALSGESFNNSGAEEKPLADNRPRREEPRALHQRSGLSQTVVERKCRNVNFARFYGTTTAADSQETLTDRVCAPPAAADKGADLRNASFPASTAVTGWEPEGHDLWRLRGAAAPPPLTISTLSSIKRVVIPVLIEDIETPSVRRYLRQAASLFSLGAPLFKHKRKNLQK